MSRILTLLLPLLALLPLHAAPLHYTYRTSDGGGIARLEADPASGKLLSHEVLYAAPALSRIKKIAVARDGKTLAANVEDVKDHANVILISPDGTPLPLSFKDRADELEFYAGHLYVGTTKGRLHRVDPADGRILHTWNFRKALTPSGRRPEDFFFDPARDHLWVSFQKDSKKRKHLGSRIVGIDLKTDRIFADLQLPRDRPGLHYDPDINGKESGPNPEVLHIDPPGNTLFVTLDLYGAVGMADLDAARAGRLENWTVLSTAPDQSWGTAFPDRVGSFRRAERTFLLVANSGPEGGAVLVDLQNRTLLQRFTVPHGLDSLCDLPAARRIVTGSSGKRKQRGSEGLKKHNRPLHTWIHFIGEPGRMRVEARDLDTPLHLLAPVDAANSPLVYLNHGEDKNGWRIQHPAESQPRARVPAFGRVQRLSR